MKILPSSYCNKIIRTVIFLTLISFPLISSDCENLTTNEEPTPQTFVGNWRLVQQTGALQDICPQENVNYRSDGVAELTCPSGQTLTRSYSISGSMLNYDQTSIQYEYEFEENDQKLNLYGVNVSRNLFYEKVITDIAEKVQTTNVNQINSSEVNK